jgi:hypothetical protein
MWSSQGSSSEIYTPHKNAFCTFHTLETKAREKYENIIAELNALIR